MAGTNNFLPFCPTDTGSNLLTQVEYAADPQLTIGNQPGVARSKLVNKALRQSTYIASVLAQYLANVTGDNVLDDENSTNLLATIAKGLKKAPTIQKFTSASGTYTRPSNPSPLYIRVRAVGGGGGGGGGGGILGGSDGTDTTFGTTLIVAGKGLGGGTGSTGGAGGSASLGAAIGTAIAGAAGLARIDDGIAGVQSAGGGGGVSPFGGAGATTLGGTGGSAVANTGSGGAGGGGGAGQGPGNGGGAGGFVDAIISAPAATYGYVVGTGGAGAVDAHNGGQGGSGYIEVTEFYQ